MRASTARLTNSPVRLADLQFPQVNRQIHRTRLAFVHLDNLLAFAKRDRDGRVDGYVAAYLPDECLLLLDRKSTRLNSSHTVIYTLSLHDALPICVRSSRQSARVRQARPRRPRRRLCRRLPPRRVPVAVRSEEHTSELQSHSDLHSFPTRRSSDLRSFISTICSRSPSATATAASTAMSPPTSPTSACCC